MKDLVDALQKIGLSEKESLVYINLLKYGSALVGTISRASGLKRPTTYVVLEELRKKGLVIEIPNSRKVLYQAKSPDDFYEQERRKFSAFEQNIPKLRSLHEDRRDLKTLYFEGVDGLKDAIFYKISLLKDSSIIGFYGSAAGLDKKIIELNKEFDNACRQNNITFSGYTVSDKSTKDILNELSQGLVNPISKQVYSSETSIEISDLFIRITDGHAKIAVIIENPRLAKTFKNIFKLASIGIEVEQNKIASKEKKS